ncbi:MAG: apolipoprotein D and lipocalin family protein [Planctomycetota bacterium]|jgi:apolipoprotein D and lipocalin family protein
MRLLQLLIPLTFLLPMLAAGCAPLQPLATAPHVELDRFMGDWYIQGHVPVGSEKNAFNAVESYARDEGSSKILTSYVFRKGSYEGELATMEPTGFVEDEGSGAVWGMRFLWPFKAEYLIAYVDEAYTETIIARRRRDYAWIMTRDPQISSGRFTALAHRLAAMGYDPAQLRRVPQQWPDAEHPVSKAGGDMARFTRAE